MASKSSSFQRARPALLAMLGLVLLAGLSCEIKSEEWYFWTKARVIDSAGRPVAGQVVRFAVEKVNEDYTIRPGTAMTCSSRTGFDGKCQWQFSYKLSCQNTLFSEEENYLEGVKATATTFRGISYRLEETFVPDDPEGQSYIFDFAFAVADQPESR
jgi:hypothetical protein